MKKGLLLLAFAMGANALYAQTYGNQPNNNAQGGSSGNGNLPNNNAQGGSSGNGNQPNNNAQGGLSGSGNLPNNNAQGGLIQFRQRR